MQQIQLGRSSLSISPLTVGCWSFGGDADSYWGLQEQSVVDTLVQAALDQGVNFFDTAFGYNDGRSEISLGKALAGRRKEAVICNKIPIQTAEELPRYSQTIADSLKRLQTDYIDVMMIHWPTRDQGLLEENLAALAREKEKGTIGHIGVSNFAVETLEIARSMGIEVVVNEFAYNLVSRGIECRVLPYCREHHIGVAAYMPIMQGLLTGKYRTLADIPPIRKRTVHFSSQTEPLARHEGPGAEAELSRFMKELNQLADQAGLPVSQLAIAWLITRPGVSTVIAGCRTLAQLGENARAVQINLDPDLVAALDQASEPVSQKLGYPLDLWQVGEKVRIW